MTKYPVYIVSKGRHKNPITANHFIQGGLDFSIVIEPHEFNDYARAVGEDRLLVLPESNKGLGSFPARNFAWADSIKKGFNKHWVFDDNIYGMHRFNGKKIIRCSPGKAISVVESFTDRYKNIGISGFNYEMFVNKSTQHPIVTNCHVYSALLIKNNMMFRWRLKYNEDVDLCLQVLNSGMCTVLFNAFVIKKTSTTVKMAGGNQDELYLNNNTTKKILKAASLAKIWPQYAETKERFGRPHHYVDWKKHFKQTLKRDQLYDWAALDKVDNFGMRLVDV